MSEADRTPDKVAQGTPADVLTRGERALYSEFGALKSDLGTLKSANEQNSRDFRWTWGGLVAGFLLLAGMILVGYTRLEDRFDQRLNETVKSLVRVETKLDDLSQRILPPPAPARNTR